MSTNIQHWICQEMGRLGIDASEEIASYILGIETADELEEYMHELLDGSEPRTQKFIKELLIKYRTYNSANAENIQVYRKAEVEQSYVPSKESKNNRQREKKSSPSKTYINGYGVENRGLMPGQERVQPETSPVSSRKEKVEKDVKKKQKYVPLFSKEGQERSVIQLAGRHPCECQAAKHKLINNCTRCGRVVCEQEGSGPCLYCGNLVCTVEENEVLSRNSKKSEKLRQHLMKEKPEELLGQHVLSNGDSRDALPRANQMLKEGFAKAEKHKEKLLEYDKTSVKRTQVIDDESDYFSTDSNQWLNKQDRELLRQREDELRSERHTSRKDRKITLDFAGRRVIEEESNSGMKMYNVNDDVVQQVHYGARPKVKGGNTDGGVKVVTSDTYLVNPNIPAEAPKFVSQSNKKMPKSTSAEVAKDTSKTTRRIQDRELLEMSDEGLCMSMHQPYASLLTCGIKIHEGRSWYTAHRGRLWIAATAKSADPAEVADVEQMYKYLYKNQSLDFPGHYPVACLLGSVEVTDCLPQDTYREKYPDGESASPYVFICTNPQELVVKFPIKGKHKIYKLDSHIHQAAKKGLR